MSLRTRHTLPFLIAIVWLAATLLLPPGLSDFEQATWLAAFSSTGSTSPMRAGATGSIR